MIDEDDQISVRVVGHDSDPIDGSLSLQVGMFEDPNLTAPLNAKFHDATEGEIIKPSLFRRGWRRVRSLFGRKPPSSVSVKTDERGRFKCAVSFDVPEPEPVYLKSQPVEDAVVVAFPGGDDDDDCYCEPIAPARCLRCNAPKRANKVLEPWGWGSPKKASTEEFEPHTCPLRREIYDDCKTLCTCCPDCTNGCAWEI